MRKPQSTFFMKKLPTSVALAAGLILSACSETKEIPVGQTGHVKGFFGAITVDEPNAALIGRQVLTAGGTAGDAAVAIGFTMAATYPGRAGLGAGGVCMVHDGAVGLTESLDFRGTAGTLSVGDRPAAVPALARGLAVLHSRYGSLDWRQLVLPAEKLARYGHRFSRAASKDMIKAKKALASDDGFRRIFTNEDGSLVSEGQQIEQLDLAAALSKIRVNGAGSFYQGPYARQIAQSIQDAGGNVSEDDLRNFIPKWGGFMGVSTELLTAYFPEPPAGGASVTAQLMGMALGNDRYEDAEDADKAHLFIEAAKRAYLNQHDYLGKGWTSKVTSLDLVDAAALNAKMENYDPAKASKLNKTSVKFMENPHSTGFVVVDRTGTAVVCDLSMNNLFGTGRVAPSLGFMVAASPNSKSRNPLNLAPMIVASSQTGRFYAGVAGAGMSDKKIATVDSYLEAIKREIPLKDVLSRPRYGVSADLKTVYVEKENGDALRSELESKGHNVQSVDDLLSRINMVFCPLGLPRTDTSKNCISETDPRGYGLSLMAVESF